MKVLDLTHKITPDMPVFPGADQPSIERVHDISVHGFAEKKLAFFSHTGTHIDSPAHIYPGGSALDDLPIDQFLGQALCLHVNGQTIGADIITAHRSTIIDMDFILISTGWERYWGDEKYFRHYPVLTREAAELLCSFSLKGVGFDTLSADAEDSTELPIHQILLKKMVIIENLTHLRALPQIPFLFSCFPINIAGADGSPVRAVAVLDNEF